MGLLDFLSKGNKKSNTQQGAQGEDKKSNNVNNDDSLLQPNQSIDQVYQTSKLVYPSPEITPVEDILKEIELKNPDQGTSQQGNLSIPEQQEPISDYYNLPTEDNTDASALLKNDTTANNAAISSPGTDLPTDDEIDKLLAQYGNQDQDFDNQKAPNVETNYNLDKPTSQQYDQTEANTAIPEISTKESNVIQEENNEGLEISLPEVIPEAGEVIPEHVPIDNTIIQNNENAVTFKSADGIVETVHPNDLSSTTQFTNPMSNQSSDNSPTDVQANQQISSETNLNETKAESQTTQEIKQLESEISTDPDISNIDNDLNVLNGQSEILNDASQQNKNNVDFSVPHTTEIEPEKNQTQDFFLLKNIRCIAFVGLNNNDGKSVEIGDDLVKFANAIPLNTELIIDSNNSVGARLLKEVNKHMSITGVFLKPFFTNYTDMSEHGYLRLNFRSILYSNYFDKISHIIDNADLIIAPLTSGLVNLASVTNFLAIQYIYSNQAKPFILLGKSWNDFIDSLKLSEDEYNSINFASNADELLEVIQKIDKEILDSAAFDSAQISTLDMREEGDENVFLRN